MTGVGSTEPAKSGAAGSAGGGADPDPRTALVGAGYDAMVDTWEAWAADLAAASARSSASRFVSATAIT